MLWTNLPISHWMNTTSGIFKINAETVTFSHENDTPAVLTICEQLILFCRANGGEL